MRETEEQSLEFKRLEIDAALKREELRLREKEIDLQRQPGAFRSLTAPQATAVGAVLTLMGGLIGAGVNGYFASSTSLGVEARKADAALELERLKFQTGLIIKGIETQDQEKAVKTLKFMAKAGLIPAYEKRIAELAEQNQGEAIPAIGVPGQPSVPYRPVRLADKDSLEVKLASRLARVKYEGSPACTGLHLPNRIVITASFCVDNEFFKHGGFTVEFQAVEGAKPPAHKVSSVKIHPEFGVAVLQYVAQGGAVAPVGQSSFRSPSNGEAVIVLHHPEGKDLAISTDCRVTQVSVAETDPQYRKLREQLTIPANRVFKYICSITYGSGGAPIFSLADNNIVGFVYASDKSGTELGASAMGLDNLLVSTTTR